MIANSRLFSGVLWLLVAEGLVAPALGQNSPKTVPVPRDPLELVTGQIQVAGTPESRDAVLQLLSRARQSFALRSSGQAFDLKVRFMVDSLGATDYDGVWEMEDLFAPGKGHRWTATASSGYTIASISTAGGTFGEGTSSVVPLRLHEARGVLFDPIQSPAFANRGSIRTATTTFRGATMTCVLLSRSRNAPNALGRAWEEAEECIDPQSGLLQIHSEAPGRYAVYDYSNAPQLRGHVMPSSVTVIEGGRSVSKVSVESLQVVATPDAKLFVPTEGMQAGAPGVAMTSATRISRIQGKGPFIAAMTMRPVCVFGMVTPTGQLVEAHSLQPSDPNSAAAVEDAKQIDFSPSIPAGAPPRQHFVFVIEKFYSPE